MKLNRYYLLFAAAVGISSCNNYYSMEDFSEIEKIDAHYHIYNEENVTMEQAEIDNFQILAINTYSGGCERVVEAHAWLKSIKKEHNNDFQFTAG